MKTQGNSVAASKRRFLRWLVPAVGTVAVLGVMAGCMHIAMAVPADLDYATTRVSEQGGYRVSYRSNAGQVPINRLHAWTLHVETSDGQAVTNATVQVDGAMPQHLHGLPTRPRVTHHLGNGDYLVEGMKFQMGGWWVMAFTIATADRTDVAKFNLML
jgi:hypothetical protein